MLAMKSLKVDFDITGQCNDFEVLSLQQLTAVPFALYAPGAGTAGPQGEAGEPGEDGEDGGAGPSAYEIWLELGNTGDEQTFINSLKGADGDDGDDFAFELPDGVQNGDYLQWIWNGTSWDITVITPDDTSIILIS